MKTFLFSFLIGANVLLVPAAALARDPMPSERSQRGGEESRCEMRSTRAEARMKAGQTVHEKHQAVFANAIARLERIVGVAEDKGVDASELSDDLENFKTAVEKIDADHQAVVDQLENMKDTDCGESVDDWKQRVADFKAAVQILHGDVADLKDLYLNEIKPDVRDIASSLKAAKGTAEDNGSNE